MKVLSKEVQIELKNNQEALSQDHAVGEMNTKSKKREVVASTLISTTSM